jgi:RloB-like protein
MNQKRLYRGPLGRKPPKHSPSGKIFLIVTEGEKTEPNYFNKLRDRLNLPVDVVEVIHPEGTDPITLTEAAIQHRDDRQKKAIKSFTTVAYDEVWVVFDLEKTHDQRRQLAKKAKNLKGAKGIHFAESDPAFEYWLLLHWEYTTAPFADCGDVCKRLKNHWPNYGKELVPGPECIENLPTAIKHAELCRQHHQNCGGTSNPSTEVDKLVQELNDAARKPYYFQL